MLSDKEQKKEFKKIASKAPDKYYATNYLKEKGFVRKQCEICNIFYWTKSPYQDTCGDSACSGGFKFIGNSPAKESLSYIDVWKKFSEMFNNLGYKVIKRYPVVARWNPTMEYTIASIAAFQPYVISGEVEPPAKKLVIPQPCLRWVDIDNVGITGAHMTGFTMIGQHQFVPIEEWNQEDSFKHIHKWLNEGLGLDDSEITFHEDAWAGGGNFGPCMEFFSRGVEIGNQVYMMYEQTENGTKELNLKVLDMGMGQERCAWFSQGCSNIYDATFPTVCKRLYEKTGIKVNEELMQKYVPLAGYLNIDETDDINKSWEYVAKKVGVEVHVLKNAILPLAALYSIAEHTRALLFALNDGALPSNVGGGYNLRLLTRRALAFIDKYNWDIYLPEVCEWHAEYLKPLYPELSENLDQVKKILDVERNKYRNTIQKSKEIVSKLKLENLTTDKLITLYDSNGISPDMIQTEFAKSGIDVDIPEDFYTLLSKRHETKMQLHTKNKHSNLDLENIKPTKALYFEDYTKTKFTAKVLKVLDTNVILDQTAFYPTSGGQLHDTGTLNNFKVTDVFKQGNVIIHKLESNGLFQEGEEINGEVDINRRIQLAQHHTATHIINAAAKTILGSHVNQAGAKKTLEKAHIDLTHYSSLTEKEIEQIEQEANSIIQQHLPIDMRFIPRTEAEQIYGMNIYQGGAIPGKELRIVNIENTDVECCGGTHLSNTALTEQIKIIKTSKISDGVIRIEFVAGNASKNLNQESNKLIEEISKLLNCKPNQIPGRAEELFKKWKKINKLKKKGEIVEQELKKLTSLEIYEGDILKKTSEMLKTQIEHIEKTVKRFLKEIK